MSRPLLFDQAVSLGGSIRGPLLLGRRGALRLARRRAIAGRESKQRMTVALSKRASESRSSTQCGDASPRRMARSGEANRPSPRRDRVSRPDAPNVLIARARARAKASPRSAAPHGSPSSTDARSDRAAPRSRRRGSTSPARGRCRRRGARRSARTPLTPTQQHPRGDPCPHRGPRQGLQFVVSDDHAARAQLEHQRSRRQRP
jgi:hypothetical protein